MLKKLTDYLLSTRQMIAVAESCTGGLLAAALTELPGSSKWFERGFVTYSNAAKNALLGVQEETLAQHGAVSHEVAQAMAEGTLRNSQAQITLAITGIAGPEGGSAKKPVGTVFIGLARQNKATLVCHQQLQGSRAEIRRKAVDFALSWLYENLTAEK